MLDVTGVVQVWHVYVLALLLGVGAACDAPARQSFVIEMVGRDDLPNAVGLNSASFNLGRVIGPALAGLLIVLVGTGPVFLINAASFGAVIFALTRMRPSELMPMPRAARRPRAAARGHPLRARPDPTSCWSWSIVFFVGTFGLNFQLTSALMATAGLRQGRGGVRPARLGRRHRLAVRRAARGPSRAGRGCG